MNAWPPGTEEGRTKRRNAAGSCKEAKIRRYPNGGTRHPGGMTPDTEHIGITGGTRGTETSKYPEEKKTKVISCVAASEREAAQTVLRHGVEGPR